MKQKSLLLWISVLCVSIIVAQGSSCPEIVETALDSVDTLCSTLDRNQACYGNIMLEAESQVGAESFKFDNLGDIVSVADIDSLELSPMNEETGEWGLVVMSLQANIPDTLPGQNVTFILFGDVSIENASTEDQNPMQAFYLQTGISDAPCEEAPESGLLIQTPDGVEEVMFNVNGVNVAVGSTVLFQAVPEEDMTITTVEGSATLDFEKEIYPAIEGTQIRLPINNQLLPTGRPQLPESYDENRVRPLPTQPLPRQIGQPPPPMSDQNLQTLNNRLQQGQPPCGVEGLPACDRMPPRLREGDRLPPQDRWGMEFKPGENCRVTDETSQSNTGQIMPPCPPLERPPRQNLPSNGDGGGLPSPPDGDGGGLPPPPGG